MLSRFIVLVAIALSCVATQAQEALVTAEGAELELISADFKFTEGPAADKSGNVYFTDQPNDRIMRLTTEGKLETWLQPCGRSNGLFFDQEGNLLACADEKNELWSIALDKSHEVLLTGYEGKLFNGPNDVWVGKDGSIYFTDPYYQRPYWERGEPQLPRRVYRLAPDRKQLTVAAEGFKQPNGIVGDAEKNILYVADIGDNKTYRFQIDEDGQLKERELFCNQGSDGMTLDSRGNLYLTGRPGVSVFSPSGDEIQVIAVPRNWTANVCFGGAEHSTLFVTASDSLFKIQMQVAGIR